MVIMLWVVSGAPRTIRGGCVHDDLRPAGPAASAGQRGHGRQHWLATPAGERVHGCGRSQPAQTAGQLSKMLGYYHINDRMYIDLFQNTLFELYFLLKA